MKMKAISFFVCLLSTSVFAAESFLPLSCEFTRSYDFKENGTVVPAKMESKIPNAYKITIDRSTGTFTGYPFNSDGIKMTVIDYGSSQQSLKIIGVSEKGWIALTTIYVDVFVDGLAKPVRFTSGNWMMTGTCRETQPVR